MIPTPEIALLLRGWMDSKRRLRVIVPAGLVHFSAYCRVFDVNEDGFSMTIGDEGRNMVGFLFEGWVFEFTDAPPDSEELLVGGKIESAIVGARRGLTLTLLLLKDED